MLEQAFAGKTATNGGLNLKEFRENLIKLYPSQETLINSLGRKELEIYFKNFKGTSSLASASSASTSSASTSSKSTSSTSTLIKSGDEIILTDLKYIKGFYTKWKYAGQNIGRFVPTEPILIQIKIGKITPPKTKPSADNFPGSKEMDDINIKLNEIKSGIDKIYLSDENGYMKISDILEYYKELKYILKKTYHLEYCTNAWLKMFEMLMYLPLVDSVGSSTSSSVNSSANSSTNSSTNSSANSSIKFKYFGNCELPGNFIMAFLYYMKSWKNIPYDWRGSSLVPSGSQDNTDALGDQYNLWANNKSRWIMRVGAKMGDEDNGDTTKIANIHHMKKELNEVWHDGADLYTSDAGISTGFGEHDDLAFNEQEQLNMLINLGQLLAMMETLKIGGNFITKQYTFMKPWTYTLMMIVASMFEKFYITKPLTSKPSNSETYLVGLNYKGISAEWKEYLERVLDETKSVVPMPGPLLSAEDVLANKDTLDILIQSAREIYDVQGELIKSNIKLYNIFKGKVDVLEEIVLNNKKEIEKDWINQYKINESKVEQRKKK
jgi:hypothetical protein